jgi:hypothetical protein
MDMVFTLTALVGGTVLVFQFVLMLLGMGGDHNLSGADGGHLAGGMDAGHFDSGTHVGGLDGSHVHIDHAGGADISIADVAGDHPTWNEAADADLGHPGAHWFYEVISLRTLSAAVTFFGLAGKTAMAAGYAPLHSFAVAIIVGLAAMYAVYWLFKQVYKLQHTGTEKYPQCDWRIRGRLRAGPRQTGRRRQGYIPVAEPVGGISSSHRGRHPSDNRRESNRRGGREFRYGACGSCWTYNQRRGAAGRSPGVERFNGTEIKLMQFACRKSAEGGEL